MGQLVVVQLVAPARVGVRRLELPASTSRTWRANQLCYTPNLVFSGAKVLLFFQFEQLFPRKYF